MASKPASRLEELLTGVPGFGRCKSCRYLEGGSGVICLACARREMEPLAPLASRCSVCELERALGASGCANPICNFPDRPFDWNRAVALKTKTLDYGIKAYKYDRKLGWRTIFSRVLVGFIEQSADLAGFDLITASPAFVGADGFDHIRELLRAMAPHLQTLIQVDAEGETIAKTMETPKFAQARSWQERHAISQRLRAALTVPNRSRADGKKILVLDDVFTSGHTLFEVARTLRSEGGAARVCGLSLARQPFRPRAPQSPQPTLA